MTWFFDSLAFPSGEGGSRVSRKRETDEGLYFFISLIRPRSSGTFPQGKALGYGL